MNIYGVIFLLVAWGLVAGCTAYCFWKLLASPDQESSGSDAADGGKRGR